MKLLTTLLCAYGTALAAQAEVLTLHRGPGHLRTITVHAAGRDAEYLFDTGGGVTAISPADSAAIGCTPGGSHFGVRLTGESLSGRTCANVSLGLGSLVTHTDAGVVDLARMLGANAPAVEGMISLQSLKGRLITLDLAANQLIVESPSSFAERTRRMTPVAMRVATGPSGGELDAFVGITAPNGATLWFEWDSENNASTLVSPASAALLGADTTSGALDLNVQLGGGVRTTIPARLKRDMIHDGVLSAAFLERATWSVDLERGRMWVSPIANIPALSSPSPSVTAPATDPTGVYDATVMVGGRPQRVVLTIARQDGRLTGTTRMVGDDAVVVLRNVTMNGSELSYEPSVPNAFTVRMTFDGTHGTGTWGDGGVKRGGAITAEKRS